MSDKEDTEKQVKEDELEPTINGKGDAPEASDEKSKDDESPESSDHQSSGDEANKENEADVKREDGEESGDEDNEEGDEEETVALLEQPVLIEGKRKRKSVERLTSDMLSPEPAEIEMPEGKGDKIGDCKRICYFLDQVKAEELKPLHRLLFGRQGKLLMIKKDIKTFNGFGFEKDSPEYKKKYEYLDRFFSTALRFLCETFDLEKKGTKEELKNRFWDFIVQPKDSGKPVPESKKTESSRASSKSKKNSKSRRSTSKKRPSTSKPKSSAASDDENDSLSDSSDGDDSPAQKKKATLPKVKAATPKRKPTPKKPVKAETKKSTPKKISPKKSPKKATPKRKAGGDDDDDEVPLAKKAKAAPSNKEIKTLVKKLLDGADLSTVTMKNIIQKVYDKYPSHDLTPRREFIRNSVKEVIS